MSIINEKTSVVGRLYVEGGFVFELLDLNPQKRTDLARDFHGEPAFAFYVVDGTDGTIAKTIVIVRSGFIIVPFAFAEERIIGFIVEDEKEAEKETPSQERIVI